MLSVDVATSPLAEAVTDLVAVATFAAGEDRSAPPELGAGAVDLGTRLGLDLAEELQAAGHRGAIGTVVRVPTRGALPATAVLAVGLGPRERAGATALRRAGAAIAGAAEQARSVSLDLVGAIDDLPAEAAAQAVAEGLTLGAYRFTRYRTDPRPVELRAATLHVSEADEDAVRAAVERAQVTAGAAVLTRDLVNTPPQDKRPPAFADQARELVAELPIEVRILDEDELEAGGYGGLLGVGRGSSEPPRLVELRYAPADADRHVALVGKGITFDTGGISLKPSSAMETMKTDMAGAATVLAVVRAAAELALPVQVTGLLALAENMPSGTATRVSDVLTLRGGTTVEVINTDAEGRLVLGDALVHASELQPDVIVDVATLTGAATVALGERIGVLMASDDRLAEELLAAGTAAGEPFWRLPLATDEYGERLEGAVADLKNSGSRAAGTIFAGLFLHRFVGEGIPWAHLDIAGVAWAEQASGEVAKGATGNPVRTLLHWLAAG